MGTVCLILLHSLGTVRGLREGSGCAGLLSVVMSDAQGSCLTLNPAFKLLGLQCSAHYRHGLAKETF